MHFILEKKSACLTACIYYFNTQFRMYECIRQIPKERDSLFKPECPRESYSCLKYKKKNSLQARLKVCCAGNNRYLNRQGRGRGIVNMTLCPELQSCVWCRGAPVLFQRWHIVWMTTRLRSLTICAGRDQSEFRSTDSSRSVSHQNHTVTGCQSPTQRRVKGQSNCGILDVFLFAVAG